MVVSARSNFHVSALEDRWRNFVLFYIQKELLCRREDAASSSMLNEHTPSDVIDGKTTKQLQQRSEFRRHRRSGRRAEVNNRWTGRPALGGDDNRDCGLVFLAEASAIVAVNHIEDGI